MAVNLEPQQLATRSTLWRWRRPLAAAAAAFLLYTLAGFFLVPRLLASQIRTRAREYLQRDASVERVRFNPFTLIARLDGFRLADRDGADLLTLDRLHLNLELSGIFRRALRFREIIVERPAVSPRVLRDGTLSIADLIETRGDPSSEPIDFPRVIVDRFALSAGVVQFSDASREPEYHARFEPLDIELSDLVTIPDEEGEHTIAIGVGDGATLRWSGRQIVEPLHFAGRLEIANLALGGLWDYLAASHLLQVRDGRADITLPYEISRASDGSVGVRLRGATVGVRSLAVRPRTQETDWLTIPELRASGVEASWPERRVDVEAIAMSGVRALARREADGAINWASVAPASHGTASAQGAPVQVRLARLALDGASVVFEDANLQPEVRLEVTEIAFEARDVSSDLLAAVPFRVAGRFAPDGTLEVSGTVTPGPLAADVQLAAQRIRLVPLAPYLLADRDIRLSDGSASLQGRGSYSAGRGLTLAADGRVERLTLLEPGGERLAAWQAMTVGELSVNGPSTARIGRITVDGAYARVLIDGDGNLNLTKVFSGTARDARSQPAAQQPRMEIGRIDLRNASAEFADDSLILPFRAQIHSANGSIRDISTFAAAPASIAIEGRVDRTGVVTVAGGLRPSDPMAASEIAVSFRSLEMPGLTPYFAEFAGYRLRSGTLDLDVKYVVKDRRLAGTHSIVARDLVLGERVRDSKGPGFAVRLAVALLKDREGRINIDVPVEGTVDDPEFAYRTVFWAAVRTILGNAAKAPFRALGRLFGRDEEDLELVEFDPGRSDLLPLEQDKLSKIAAQLVTRPELTLSIEGRYDANADATAMRREKFDALIESRRGAAAAAAAAGGASTLETILEALYVERFGGSALQSERVKFGAPAATAVAPAAGASATATGAPAAAGTTQPAAAFDAAGFYDSLRARLLDAQTVTEEDLAALASARAQAIVAALTTAAGLAPSRVTAAEPATVRRSRAGSTRIASELTMSAGPEDADNAP